MKTHITLNTLLQDGETDEALLVARAAAAAGADALIVQDLGLARRLRQVVPDLALHASTQLSIHDENGVRAAKRLGFSRVVLARELSLEEIRKICHSAAELGMEIEAFIHGALCMSVSGQCYLSAMIGGRSGNRGLCAQPCRLPFSAGGDSGYALSLKDMSHLSQIGALAGAGVVSFKIEGRMKPPEYVAAAVTAAREARDAGRVSEKTGRLLESVFSRSGFTDGYLSGKRRDMFGIRTEADKTMAAAVENSPARAVPQGISASGFDGFAGLPRGTDLLHRQRRDVFSRCRRHECLPIRRPTARQGVCGTAALPNRRHALLPPKPDLRL